MPSLFWLRIAVLLNPRASYTSVDAFSNRYVYRTIQISSEEHKSVLSGNDIFSTRLRKEKCKKSKGFRKSGTTSLEEVREHVLKGSSSKRKSSQFISTTRDLKVALKFAAPFHLVVRIDLSKYEQLGGKIIDLSTNEAFEARVPPLEGDIYSDTNSSSSDIYRMALDSLMQASYNAKDCKFIMKDKEYLMGLVANTEWECARLFATRSKEVLLQGKVWSECISIANYSSSLTHVKNLPYGRPILIDDFKSLSVLEREGGANAAMLRCKHVTADTNANTTIAEELVLKQAKPNINPSTLKAKDMRYSIDAEFAAFEVYRIMEEKAPDMEINVRDCAKLDFKVEFHQPVNDHEAELQSFSLNCLVFRPIPAQTKPVTVSWTMVPVSEEQVDIFAASHPKLSPDYSRIIRKDQFMERERSNPAVSKKEVQNMEKSIPEDQIFLVWRRIETKYAERLLRGVAVDILLANTKAWGVQDKSNRVVDSNGKIYRMSADHSLGVWGTEQLNMDSRGANLFSNTLEGDLFFKTILEAVIRQEKKADLCKEYQRKLDLYYKLRDDFPELVLSQIFVIQKIIQRNPFEVNAIFANMQISPDRRRIAEMYPEESQRVRDFHSKLWRHYLLKRCAKVMQILECENSLVFPESCYHKVGLMTMWEDYTLYTPCRHPIFDDVIEW